MTEPKYSYTNGNLYSNQPFVVPKTADGHPKGFVCACGEYHAFGVWVFAHWQELLTFTCPSCSRVYTVCAGRATEDKPKKRRTGIK